MILIDDIVKAHSVSVVGLEKNTGKTECLNYIVRNLPLDGRVFAVTSIGVDGETTDAVTGTSKPEIFLREGMLFSTSEKHYLQRHIMSELLDISDESTALGRVVTAKALDYGKVLLSGPSTAKGLERWIKAMRCLGVTTTLIDGAISRLSSASPAISEAMVLTTGAALSANLPELVRRTVHVVSIIMSPRYSGPLCRELSGIEQGIWRIGCDDVLSPVPGGNSALALSAVRDNLVKGAKGIFVAGAVTDRIVDRIVGDGADEGFAVIARDFTRVFVSPSRRAVLEKQGIRLELLQVSRLLAVCANPVSPNGMVLDSSRLCEKLADALPVPVYDLFRLDN